MAAPISQIEKIVIISNDGKMGTSKITGELASMMTQLPTVVKSLSGFDLEEWVRKLAKKEKSEKIEPPQQASSASSPDKE